MDDSSSPTEFWQRYRGGDPDAARALFDHYAQRLCRLAEQHLSRKLAGRIDGEDVVQSALRSFFLRAAGGEFQIDSRGQLWQLLAKITVQKARQQARRHTADRRDVDAEQPGAATDGPLAGVSHEPGPEDAVIVLDQIESLLQGLPELHGTVLQFRLQGLSVAEIAEQLGITRQAVYRTLDLLQERLARSV